MDLVLGERAADAGELLGVADVLGVGEERREGAPAGEVAALSSGRFEGEGPGQVGLVFEAGVAEQLEVPRVEERGWLAKATIIRADGVRAATFSMATADIV